ncbi:MAG: phosphatase PAP2 family protein, partial [Phycisphaerae bacterium]|nr:phosphatase PAP2 family protein [Phycisphaerae bacterium]
MQGCIRADGASTKNSINLIRVAVLMGALLFGAGCQKDSARISDGVAIRHAQLSNGGYDDVGRTGGMVRLASLESLESMGRGLVGTVAATEGVSGPRGVSKWDTAMSDLWDLPGVAWDDAQTVVQKPTNLVILGVAGGLSIWGEFGFDNRVDESLRGRDIINDDWTIAVGTAGNPGTHFTVALAIYTHGLLTENSQTYDFGKTLTQALVLNGLATMGLKLVANNHSPNGELFGWPSGHTSSTMTVASVVHEYYGIWPAAPLYALTGLVMYERMITGEHWASDVIFGAALGYVIGHSV